VVSESAVRTHLHELRQLLGGGVIETVIGRGYRFIAELTADAPGPAQAGPEVPAVVAPALPAQPRRLIVGRDRELSVLRAALDRARAGHRQTCFVTGEPGIGKTTLVDTFLDELTGGTPLFACALLDDLEARGVLARQGGAWTLAVSIDELAAHRPTVCGS
jgi:hypothetical protein